MNKKSFSALRLIFAVSVLITLMNITSYQLKAEETPSPEVSAEPTPSASPEVSPEPTPEATPEVTTEATTEAPKPKVKLGKPKIKSISAYDSGKMKIKWTAVEGADYYRIYRKYKGKKYKMIDKTKKTSFSDKKAKANKECYYKIQAVKKETETTAFSTGKKSKALHKKSRKKPERIAYLGDSVMSGFELYGYLDSNERSFAKVSLFVQQIRTTFLSDVNTYEPDRVYIMCGTNNCVGNQNDTYLKGVVAEYKEVIKNIHKNNPNCEIVIMGIGNTRTTRVPNSTVNRYNSMLKKLADYYSYANYFDTGSVLNDSSGSLSSGYAAGDGIHWSAAAYKIVHEKLKEFTKVY